MHTGGKCQEAIDRNGQQRTQEAKDATSSKVVLKKHGGLWTALFVTECLEEWPSQTFQHCWFSPKTNLILFYSTLCSCNKQLFFFVLSYFVQEIGFSKCDGNYLQHFQFLKTASSQNRNYNLLQRSIMLWTQVMFWAIAVSYLMKWRTNLPGHISVTKFWNSFQS